MRALLSLVLLTFSLLATASESVGNGIMGDQLAVSDSPSCSDLALPLVGDDSVCIAAIPVVLPVPQLILAVAPLTHHVSRVEHTRHIRAPPSLL